MKTQDAIKYFGSQKKLKEALHLRARQTIHAWGEFPPDGRQYQIEILTDGALRAERSANDAPEDKRHVSRRVGDRRAS